MRRQLGLSARDATAPSGCGDGADPSEPCTPDDGSSEDTHGGQMTPSPVPQLNASAPKPTFEQPLSRCGDGGDPSEPCAPDDGSPDSTGDGHDGGADDGGGRARRRGRPT